MYAIRSYYEGFGIGQVVGQDGIGVTGIVLAQHVITSYSIHYTKLYDEILVAGQPQRHGAGLLEQVIGTGIGHQADAAGSHARRQLRQELCCHLLVHQQRILV